MNSSGAPEDLPPPADPWMHEAPTLTDAEPGTPATRRFEPGRGRPRPRSAIPAVVVVLLLVIAGVLLFDHFGPDDEDTPSTAPAPTVTATATTTRTATVPAPAPATTATTPATGSPVAGKPASPAAVAPRDAAEPQVVYEITVGGSRNRGDISYTDADGEIIRRNGIALPWRTAFPADPPHPRVIEAQRTGGGDGGAVTCTITENGKVLQTTTHEGPRAYVLC